MSTRRTVSPSNCWELLYTRRIRKASCQPPLTAAPGTKRRLGNVRFCAACGGSADIDLADAGRYETGSIHTGRVRFTTGYNRWGHRDATAILIAYRHGLRSSELVALRWDDIDLPAGKLHVRRAKGGTASVHPIGGRELRPAAAKARGPCRRLCVRQ